MSEEAVLLADILPTLVIKLAAPCVIHKLPYGFRVLFCALMAATSFLLVSFSSAMWMSILGVIFASISAGLGELSFLSLSVYFSRDVLGAWGSGTGGAGVAGAFLYSGLTQVGLSPQVTLQIMLVVPFALLISYFFLLAPPPTLSQWREKQYAAVVSEERQQLMDDSEEEEQGESTPGNRSSGPLTPKEKLHVIRGLMRFVFPLGLVYFAEYFINQGLGLLGGAAYVNTFYFISKESEDRHREFAMAAASVGDSLGIALAGLAAFPVHRYFCSL
ncbi:hypothetical protein JOQ06_010680 [Pogonophryne albipinna]|uniref:Battenin n=1 Tax=Pogonophryne albipinna TaxID=1090488 RepID=A0AAD6AWV9_9TELE|nr:hypothetical protein JOQ06_010680 [Pogonophryne albipinna]